MLKTSAKEPCESMLIEKIHVLSALKWRLFFDGLVRYV